MSEAQLGKILKLQFEYCAFLRNMNATKIVFTFQDNTLLIATQLRTWYAISELNQSL